MGSFHPRVSFTEPARFWFLGITLFPDNKSVQPLFIDLHLTKEISVYFVCLKSTNSIEGMTNEILTQELVHTFNHTGRNLSGRLIVLPIVNDTKIHYLQQEQELAKSPSL